MKITVHLPNGTTRAQAEKFAQGIEHFVGGSKTQIEDSHNALSEPHLTLKQLEDTSRLIVANVLGVHVATVGPMEAALVMTLHECQGVFASSKELFIVLEACWPCWKGQRHQTRSVYAHVKKKLAHTRYPLVDGKGRYGFRARLDGEEPPDISVVEGGTR